MAVGVAVAPHSFLGDNSVYRTFEKNDLTKKISARNQCLKY